MRQLKYTFLFFFLILSQFFNAQPAKPNSSEIYQQIRKLNFLGSVLYIAAHPDDENTRLITYFSNNVNARTGYLSMTRGDGGQDLIGPELRELLGVIRTQELLEARKIDGGEQFFTRANDFGYSKTPDETFTFWNKQEVLSDVVRIIRKFQPDVIINRFDSRTPGSTHGHHTASAMLSLDAFALAGKSDAYPEQLSMVKPWRPRRVFFNTSWWFYGSQEKFDKADKSKLSKIETGSFYPLLGKSNQEIAALSRSRHQSQGFGSTGSRGSDIEYLEFLQGEPMKNKSDIFEGIDTSWNRVKGGSAIGRILSEVENNFDFKKPETSLPNLIKAYKLIQQLEDAHWKEIKTEEIKKVIAACAGLYLEPVAEVQQATPGSEVKANIEAINRSSFPISLSAIKSFAESSEISQNKALGNNEDQNFPISIKIPQNAAFTSPYWLNDNSTTGMYSVADPENIGVPDVIRAAEVTFELDFNGTPIPYSRKIIYKYNDGVKGEVYMPFDIIPEVSTSIADKVTIFRDRKTKIVTANVIAGQDNAGGVLKLDMPTGWKSSPTDIPFQIDKKGGTFSYSFEVTPPAQASEATITAIATVDGRDYNHERVNIDYPHISSQMVLQPATAKLINVDIKTGNERIAYIMGAGDEVYKSLMQMGYDVTIVKPDAISAQVLANYDVVITGIRAYNTVDVLASKQQLLMDFVRQGKTMIVQYNTTGELVTKDFSPFPLKISKDRVTEENAEVRLLKPDHPILNKPNKITADDFKNWKQELGLYFPDKWDPAFTPILSANDKGESAKNGALLIAKYGKGQYIYTGLSFFRELPEGVPGAFRLMANLISAGK